MTQVTLRLSWKCIGIYIKPTVLQTPLQNRRFSSAEAAAGDGRGRHATGDGVVVVGMMVGRAGRGVATQPCHGCGVFPLSLPLLVLVLWAISDGRRATGDSGGGVVDGCGRSSCLCASKTDAA